jgi:hypothetical protein
VITHVTAPESALRVWQQRWNWFWFNPADPTPLGVIRVFAGLFVFYIHLAYTVDLQELLGEHAWLDLQQVNEMRLHAPFGPPRPSWDMTAPWPPRAQGPQTEEEKSYFQKYNVFPEQTMAQGTWGWSIWYHVTDPTWMAIVHGIILVIMLLFAIGFCTRITSVLTWVASVSYVNRAATSFFGMDMMANILLIYLMIGPSGAAVSADRLIQRYWGTWRALRERRPAPRLERPTPMISANFALRLIQINFCMIYLASGTSKLQGSAWWSGTAVWLTLANPEFAPMAFPWYQQFLVFLCKHRWLWETVIGFGCLFTLVLEISLPFLIWVKELRWVMILGAVMLHTGIAAAMALNVFGLLMLTMLLAFVPPETINRVLGYLGRGADHFRLHFNPRARRQARAASAIHALDVWEQVRLGEGTAHPADEELALGAALRHPEGVNGGSGDVAEMELFTAAGERLTGYALFERLSRSLHLLWPVAWITWLPGARALGNALYPSGPASGSEQFDAGRGKPIHRGEKVSK